jgi:hypothetical protein
MMRIATPITCALLALFTCNLGKAAPGDRAGHDPLAPDLSFTSSYQLVEKQLQHLVPGSTAVADPFGGAPVRPEKPFDPEAAAASAREALITKFGVKISSADPVEIEFRKRHRMVVVAPPEIQRSIASALDGILAPPQVHLKLHVFELPEAKTLTELLGAPGNIIDAQQLAALEKRVVALGGTRKQIPHVVATCGQRCKIEIIREVIYPTEYDPPQVPEVAKKGVDGEVIPAKMVAPANPTAFDVRNVGLTWEVEALLREDGAINLSGVVEEVQFNGFINYGSPINGIMKGEKGEELVKLTDNRILQPVFGSSRVPTNFTVPAGKLVAVTGFAPQPQEKLAGVLDKDENFEGAAAHPKTEEAKPHVYVIEVKRVADPE